MAKKEVTNLANDVSSNATELIRQAHRESAGFDLRSGSALTQLFVNRLADFLQPVVSLVARILGGLNVNLSTDWETYYAVLGSLYLTSRDTGQKATGQIVIGLSAPGLVEIPANTVFSTPDGVQFVTTREYVFSSTHLSYQNEVYYTPPITVEAGTAGEINIAAASVVQTSLDNNDVVDVYNPNPITGGAAEESYQEFVDRLRNGDSTRTLTNLPGIKYALQTQFTSLIQAMEIVGAGDAEMDRDLVYDYSKDISTIFGVVDFARKVENSTAEEPSEAFTDLRKVIDPTFTVDGNDVVTIDDFEVALSQTEYNQIGSMDSVLLQHASEEVMTEDWTRDLEPTSMVSPWVVAETNDPQWESYAGFVSIESGTLTLGANAFVRSSSVHQSLINHVLSTLKGSIRAQLGTEDYRQARQQLNAIITSDVVPADFVDTYDFFEHLVEQAASDEAIEDFSTVRANVSPAIQREISQNSGVVFRGDFTIENDDQSKPRPLYITNFRKTDGNPQAHDGFGIAIFPTSDPGLHNIFVSDNNALADEVMVAGPEIYDAMMVENYLMGVEATINVGQKYQYEISYGEMDPSSLALSMDVRIWADGGSRPVNPTLSYGAYTPMNVRDTDILGQSQTGISPTSMGFGVLQTGGFQWSVGPVKVLQQSGVYAQMLYEMDVSKLNSDEVELYVDYRGAGENGGVVDYGATLRVLDANDPQNPVWEEINTNMTQALYASRTVLNRARYTDGDDKLYILVSSLYPHSPVAQIESTVDVDYVAVAEYYAGTHTNGRVDVYIQRKDASSYPETEAEIDLTGQVNSVVLNTENGFNRPVTRVMSVEILDGSGNPTGSTLTEYTDYRVISNDPPYDGSAQESKILLFSDAVQVYDVRITYRYIPDIDLIQSFVEGETAKPADADILVKHMKPKFVSVSFTADYTGTDLVEAIEEYIYEASERVTAYEIITLAREYGVSSAQITGFTLSSFYYDGYGNRITESSADELTKTRVQVFVPEDITITP